MSVSNSLNNWSNWLYTKLVPPPQTDQFQINGQLSPDQFKRAGDKLTQVCQSWKWKPSSNPKYISKYLDEKKQYLVFQKALCKKRIGFLPMGKQQTIENEQGQEVIVLHTSEIKQFEKQEIHTSEIKQFLMQDNIRYYTMYIIYDEAYHTPRMFFSATKQDGTPVDNQLIKEDIQKQYIDKTLTMEPFPFIPGLTMPTVHPCKHANVLKSMSDAMRESGHKVESHFALLIFLKFITSVIPTVQFDITGDLHFQ